MNFNRINLPHLLHHRSNLGSYALHTNEESLGTAKLQEHYSTHLHKQIIHRQLHLGYR